MVGSWGWKGGGNNGEYNDNWGLTISSELALVEAERLQTDLVGIESGAGAPKGHHLLRVAHVVRVQVALIEALRCTLIHHRRVGCTYSYRTNCTIKHRSSQHDLTICCQVSVVLSNISWDCMHSFQTNYTIKYWYAYILHKFFGKQENESEQPNK